MKLLPTTIEQCYKCPYATLVADMGFGMMYSFKCRFLWGEKIPDEGILAACPLDDDLPDIRKQ